MHTGDLFCGVQFLGLGVDSHAQRLGAVCWLSATVETTFVGGFTVHDAPHLSYREIQILKLAGAGYTTSQIARIVGSSYSAVDTHKGRVFRKLAAFNVAHALIIAHQLGLLNVADIQPIRVSFLSD